MMPAAAGDAGYREIEHTADWELEVWAPDLAGLLEQAARGMSHLAGVRLQDSPTRPLAFSLTAADAESLLVSFLGELLFHMEQSSVGFNGYALVVKAGQRTTAGRPEFECNAALDARPLLSLDKEIKAVTYHRLEILRSAQGVHTRIVFDV